jgi:predicted protein tyrosine phosphatase
MTGPPAPERERLLFVCTFNLSRSRTAEVLLVGHPLYDARSAGTHLDARVPLTAELVGWADRVLVMESHHADFVRSRFPTLVHGKPMVVLEIPDDYPPMAEDLILLLQERLARYLIPRSHDAGQ